MKKINVLLITILTILSLLAGCTSSELPISEYKEPLQTETGITTQEHSSEHDQEEFHADNSNQEKPNEAPTSVDLSNIPVYSGKPYVAVNGNTPFFTSADHSTSAFEKYSSLDSLGRCGVAFANICIDIMPTEERGNIGSVKPSGWHTVKYEIVDGKYLYNRCHLIGFQLAGENANEHNLITGTRYMNVEGMLPFENMVDAYVEETENHVLYRVTPIYDGNNLLASGVLMEGWSVEDNGDGICFNVFCYNVQPGIKINYSTGDSEAEDGSAPYGSLSVDLKPTQAQLHISPIRTQKNFIIHIATV